MRDDEFINYKKLLFSIAYRMLGSATDAEDMVQEAFLRWQSASPDEVRSPKSYLSAVVTRLCIDQLRSAQAQRELYLGPWLPEPIITRHEHELDGQTRVEQIESICMAFLLLLESLGPVERAVFLLYKVFDYSYAEIADIVGKSEANCRQMAKRAQQRIQAARPRFSVSREQQEQTTRSFLQVCAGGDMQSLLAMLAGDVVLMSDGGGKAQAARNPIYGAQNVARFIQGVLNKLSSGPSFTAALAEINGQTGIVTYLDGIPNGVLLLDLDDDKISRVHIVVNPDKLTTLN